MMSPHRTCSSFGLARVSMESVAAPGSRSCFHDDRPPVVLGLSHVCQETSGDRESHVTSVLFFVRSSETKFCVATNSRQIPCVYEPNLISIHKLSVYVRNQPES